MRGHPFGGSFQSELGCPGDWQPECLRSWLQDPDGDGTYEFSTTALPAGAYEAKVAIDESWSENYGAGGVAGGPNITFAVAADFAEVVFSYDATTHVLTITGMYSDDQPSVVSVDPADGATDVLRSTNITVTFSEPVDVTADWFDLSCDGSAVSATSSGGPTTFTIDPDVLLPPEAVCTVVIDGGAVTDQDALDPPDGPLQYSWSFTTAPLTVAERFDAVNALIVALATDAGIEKSMLSKVNDAYAYWQAGNPARACSTLGALRKEISALKGKKKLSNAVATQLTAAVQELQAAIGC